ncbi:unnamed protein product [Pieris brassicae]|uniref:Partial AB-hydrolase lipase domain-containing protein n=1 Tax=Pieris brassicae TaxID=7116 RepID=A0A9P0TAR4_PIEBR|nr:unnamed protein product [Pieris brassicae]
MLRSLVVLVCVVSALAGQSPNAAFVEELVELYNDGRFSDNLQEDASLDVPELVRKYGYPLEEHTVETSDGYILTMHRIPHGREASNDTGQKPVVFMMHGLLSSSADYVLMGPGSGLAPVAFMANNRNLLLNALAPFARSLSRLANLIGIGEFMPNRLIYTWAGQALCKDEALFQPICSSILFLIAGWNEKQHNATMLPVIFGHTPAGASVRQFAHYGQGISGNKFRRFDHGMAKNLRMYGRISAPDYDLRKITTPVFLHYSTNDPLAHVNDVDKLWSELKNPVGKFKVQENTFSHLDFMYGIDARALVYNRVISFLRVMDSLEV